jgi:methylphosphotriester-DNA--protein-cysteine methyltransferase
MPKGKEIMYDGITTNEACTSINKLFPSFKATPETFHAHFEKIQNLENSELGQRKDVNQMKTFIANNFKRLNLE